MLAASWLGKTDCNWQGGVYNYCKPIRDRHQLVAAGMLAAGWAIQTAAGKGGVHDDHACFNYALCQEEHGEAIDALRLMY